VRNRSLIIVTISLATLLATQCTYTPPPRNYHLVLPDNYIGWVRIDFGVPSAPDWHFINFTTTLTIPETGVEQIRSSFVPPGKALNFSSTTIAAAISCPCRIISTTIPFL